jgi:DNA-binding transcriptional regulator YiaG
LGNTQRIITVKYDHSNQKFSPRKVFPIAPKTIGDHLVLSRCVADLSQEEVAALIEVSNKILRAWEYDKQIPTNAAWERLVKVLPLDPDLLKTQQ